MRISPSWRHTCTLRASRRPSSTVCESMCRGHTANSSLQAPSSSQDGALQALPDGTRGQHSPRCTALARQCGGSAIGRSSANQHAKALKRIPFGAERCNAPHRAGLV
jgi:hypothetical protein